MKRWFPAALFALLLAWSPNGMGADLIPAERLADWTPGVTVGVPGGIPTDRTNLIDVTKAPYNADNTGKEDAQPAITKAIADAKAKDVVYLPAGTYRVKGISLGWKSNITLRGAGPDKTFLMGPVSMGSGGADWWYPNRLGFNITGSPKRGDTVLTVGDTKPLDERPNGGIGEPCQVALKNDLTLPVGTPKNFEYLRKQASRIVAKTPTTVTISPGLLFDLPEALAPRLRPAGLRAESLGIEDLTIDGTDSGAASCCRWIRRYGCWVKNVKVTKAAAYLCRVGDALQCEIRHCYDRQTQERFRTQRRRAARGLVLLLPLRGQHHRRNVPRRGSQRRRVGQRLRVQLLRRQPACRAACWGARSTAITARTTASTSTRATSRRSSRATATTAAPRTTRRSATGSTVPRPRPASSGFA